MDRIILRKFHSTWYWTHENKQGGSFASNYCGPKYIALARATYTLQPGTQYELITNGKSEGVKTK